MLPIFSDDFKSTATIKHLLDVLIKFIHYLNPNQTAVIGFDQPVAATKTQRLQPTPYRQQKPVVDDWNSSHQNGDAPLFS